MASILKTKIDTKPWCSYTNPQIGLSTKATEYGWKMGVITQCPTLLFKNDIQISFERERLSIHTGINDECYKQQHFSILYNDMRENIIIWEFVLMLIMGDSHYLIKKTNNN